NLIAQGTNNHLLDGRPALEELQFTKDPDGRFDGVNDVFSDGSFFAILTPGHTAGHTSYLARTTAGPVLLTGAPSHLRRAGRTTPSPDPSGRPGAQPSQSARLEGAERASPEHGRETGSPALSPDTP